MTIATPHHRILTALRDAGGAGLPRPQVRKLFDGDDNIRADDISTALAALKSHGLIVQRGARWWAAEFEPAEEGPPAPVVAVAPIAAPASPEPLLLNVAEAAHLLGLAPKTLYEYSSQGLIASVKVGRLLRFRRVDLEAFVENRARGAA